MLYLSPATTSLITYAAILEGQVKNPTQALIAAAALALALAAPPLAAANKAKFSDYQHGKPVDYLPCATAKLAKRTAVLMGGGIDVKEALSWMIAKMSQCGDGSAGKPGNFLVIRAGGNPSYDSFIYKLGPLAAVQTIVIPNFESADDPAVVPYIKNAGAIWLTGGDQGDYYNFWKGSKLVEAINSQVNSYGIPIGGTSAGMMILSQIAYIADPETITSAQALQDPYTAGAVTLKNDFWPTRTPFPPLMSTVTDSHFDTRDRMGRLITFLARTKVDGLIGNDPPKALGVDQEAALLMESGWGSKDFTWRMVANPGSGGAAYLLSPASNSTLVVAPGTPLTFTKIRVQKFTADDYQEYGISVDNGSISSNSGSIY